MRDRGSRSLDTAFQTENRSSSSSELRNHLLCLDDEGPYTHTQFVETLSLVR